MRRNAVLLLLSVIVVFLLVSIFIFNSTIMRTNAPKVLKGIVQLVWPPPDLFEPLFNEAISIDDSEVKTKVIFSHKYHGTHEIGLLFDKLGSELYPNGRSLKWATSITCNIGDDSVLSHHTQDVRPFLARIGNGFSLFAYQVPTDLVFNKEIECNISIKGITKDFMSSYGPAKLYIRKLSDL